MFVVQENSSEYQISVSVITVAAHLWAKRSACAIISGDLFGPDRTLRLTRP